MRNKFLSYTMMLVVMATIMSCSKIMVEEEQETVDDKPANSTLIVTATSRTSDTEEDVISYPVNVYVFDDSGTCVDLQTITSTDDVLSFKLPEGTYDIYAVAGASTDNYELPTQADATKESVITLLADKEHCDLMTATTNDLTLTANEENTLELGLERKVLMIQSIIMSNIPTDVEELTVSISPLYTTLLLNGSYGSETGSATISLTKSDEATAWTSSSPVYLFASKSAPSITVKMKRTGDNIVKSYTYSLKEALSANYKFNIKGTYDGDKVSVAGVISGTKWAGTTEIKFNYGDDSTDSSDEYAGTELETGDIPTVGTAYKGCYVLSVDDSSNPVAVTLMAPKSYNEWTFTKGDTEQLQAEVEKKLSDISTEGVSGWRLPTQSEIEFASKNISSINTNIANINSASTGTSLESLYTKYAYLFKSDDTIKSYCYYSDSNIYITNADEIGSGKSTYLRAFTTVYFSK